MRFNLCFTANCQLPTANCQLPTANCQLPTAYCLLPTAYCLLCDSPSTADFLLESPLPGFENLVVWQRAVELSASIYCETRDLKDFGFRDQITRAGLSVPSNIAEGMERSTPADQCKFLDYARASCGEIRTQTIVGTKVGFLSQDVGQNWCHETRELAAMINGLINSISKRRP